MSHRNRLAWLTFPLVLLAAAAPAAPARADVAEGLALLRRGDAAADKGDTTEAVILYKRAFETLLPGMRKVRFKHEVKRDVTAREDLQKMVLKEMDEEMTPAELRANELGMKALGLVPRDFDVRAVTAKVLAEEIAAFYDTKTKTMHLIKEPEAKAKKPPTFFERLMGKKAGFDKDENKTVIAHELTHALADQNYDIDKMVEAVKGNDDRTLAVQSLVEGEATLTMIAAQMQDWSGTAVVKIPAANLDRVFSLMGPFLPLAGGKALRDAPPILSESLIFPYLRGMVFCARLANDGGWEALDEAYRNPPLSSEQIIHPEKYKAKPDLPTEIDLGKLDPGPGWKEVGRNVVGEMTLGVLLRRHGGKNAAAGWDGDRFAVFEQPGGRLGLVWTTTWDTEDDAGEFLRGYARFQSTKMGDGVPAPDAFPDAIRRPHQGTIYAVERRGRDVAVVEGFEADPTDELIARALASEKHEIKPGPAATSRPEASK
jgi:hypothetical protein